VKILTTGLFFLINLISITAMAQQLVINDSFSDGGRNNGTDAYDANWWTTTSNHAIEIKPGTLGLVSGTSGRGIRTTFPPQELIAGKTIKASFTFNTPETVGTNKESSLRFGMYDKLNRLGLEGDLLASSKKPNSLFDGLPGYMIDFDINLKDSSLINIGIRRHLASDAGRLLSTTKAYKLLGEGGIPYNFEANQTYTGSMTLKKISTGSFPR